MRRAAGAVVVDVRGRILLRRPTDEYGGYAWTFPKGGVDAGESAEQTAARETIEETGYACGIVAPLGDFVGDTSVTRFFLAMRGAEVSLPDAAETEAVAWVTWDAARELIMQSRSARGRARDLAVLDAARQLLAAWRRGAFRHMN